VLQNVLCFTVHGAWGDWAAWEPCSKTCGKGERTRARECNNPTPLYGGDDCPGLPVETAICNVRPCPGKFIPRQNVALWVLVKSVTSVLSCL
jgi:hypothetical protein